MKKVAAGISGGMLAVVLSGCGTHVTPEASTFTAISQAAEQVHAYMREHRQVPTDFSTISDHAPPATDGWGRPLMYAVDDAGIVSISSYGRDGRPGGQDSDADITRRYRTRTADGALDIDDDLWVISAEVSGDASAAAVSAPATPRVTPNPVAPPPSAHPTPPIPATPAAPMPGLPDPGTDPL